MTEIRMTGKKREPYHNLHLPIEIWQRMTEYERIKNSMLLLPGIFDSQTQTYVMGVESMKSLRDFQNEMREKYN